MQMDTIKYNKLLKSFSALADSKKNAIKDLQRRYLEMYAKNAVVQAMFNEVYDDVLQDGNYYADTSIQRGAVTIAEGDRILSHKFHYLMSEADFAVYLEVCKKKFFEKGLTDSDGLYTTETNTEMQLSDIKEQLLVLAIDILPDDFPNKIALAGAVSFIGKNSYHVREKLFELIMSLE